MVKKYLKDLFLPNNNIMFVSKNQIKVLMEKIGINIFIKYININNLNNGVLILHGASFHGYKSFFSFIPIPTKINNQLNDRLEKRLKKIIFYEICVYSKDNILIKTKYNKNKIIIYNQNIKYKDLYKIQNKKTPIQILNSLEINEYKTIGNSFVFDSSICL